MHAIYTDDLALKWQKSVQHRLLARFSTLPQDQASTSDSLRHDVNSTFHGRGEERIQLSEERVGDLKRWIDALTAIQMAQRGRLVLSDEDDLRDKHRGSGD